MQQALTRKPPDWLRSIFMKTKGEIEAAICEAVTSLRAGLHGPRTQGRPHPPARRSPRRPSSRGFDRSRAALGQVAQQKGRDLLKQVRTHLIETARPVMEAMIEKVTGVKVVTMHHDISTVTGEEVVLFTLARSPDYREAKMK